ncbi:MAG: Ig-like domain repeat protein [Acidobacteriaceae bacterium]
MKAATSLRLCCALAIVFVALFVSASANAQVAPLVTQTVDPAQRQVLRNTIHPLVKNAADLGRADSSLAMKDMLLMLHPSASQAAIAQYIDSLHNPQSANFHRWLTPEQYAAQFGIADTDVKTVSAWLTASGFTVEQVARGKRWIRFSGTASLVENAFQTEIHKYSLHGATQYANSQNISIPAALAPAVSGVVSMSSFQSLALHTPPQKIARGSNGKMALVPGTVIPTLQGAQPDFTDTNGQTINFLAPDDFSTIYDAKPAVSSGINGAGVSIAIVGRSDIAISDVEAFRTISGLPFNDPTVTYATTDPGVVSGDDIEGSLDVEWSGAIAPQASINFVIGASTTTTDGVDISASYIVDNVVAPIVSVSFGLCEQLEPDSEIAFYQILWQQAAAEGITAFIAAGDSGASSCNYPGNPQTQYGFGVSALASTPYTVAVGGTELNDLSNPSTYWNTANGPYLGSAIGYIPEAVWNESCSLDLVPSLTNCAFAPYNRSSFAGGGGASSCITRTSGDGGEICAGGYPKPTWQTGPGVPQDGVRDLPDVSLSAAAAHDPFIVCFEGGCLWTTNSDGSITLEQADLVGGTSAASPSMASIMALVEQRAGAFQGVANYELYSLAAAQTSGACDSSSRTNPAQPSTCVFNDITAGSNAVPCFSGDNDCGSGTDAPVVVGATFPAPVIPPNAELNGNSATAGYDLGSGLGSVDISNLVNSWSKQNLAASSTTLALSKSTFQHGTSVTLSGVVAPASGTGTPTGNVLIEASSASGSVVSFPLAAGAFSGSTINLPGGTSTVTATYSGDGVYAASTSAPVSVTVAPENSTVTATSFAYSPLLIGTQNPLRQTNAALLGYPWFLQFNVAGVSGSTRATGTIALSQGGVVVGTYPLSSNGELYLDCGQDVGTGCDFPVGTLNFTAKYSGDSSFNASTTTYQFTVLQGGLRIDVNVNNQTPIANSQVIATAFFELTDPAIPPTGTVTLIRSDTGALLGSGALQGGVATIPFQAPAGYYQVIPHWPGDANYAVIGMNGIPFIDTESNPGTLPVHLTLSLGATSFGLGQRSQYTVAVTPTQQNAATPIGYIVLYSSAGQITAPVALAAGKATGTVEWDAAGPQSVYAVYQGDFNYAGANSTPSTVTVTQAAAILMVQPVAAYAAVGSVTSVSALLTSPLSSTSAPAPTGTIQFYNSLNQAAAAPIGSPQAITTFNGSALLATLAPTLPQGSNVVTAVYSGDANWKSVSSAPSAPIVVSTADFAVTATPSPLTVTAGQPAVLSITTKSFLGYSAAINLSCGGTLPPGTSCNTATVSAGGAGSITLTTTAPGTISASPSAKSDSSFWRLSGSATFAALFLLCIPNRRRFAHLAVLLFSIAVVFGMAACGGGGVGGGGTNSQPTSLSLTSSSSKVASGGSVTFQATLSSTSSTGSVTFYDGTTALGSGVTPQNGVATYTTGALSVGTHSITAKYQNGSQTLASSDVLEQAITGSFTLMISGTSGKATQSVNVPATLQ